MTVSLEDVVRFVATAKRTGDQLREQAASAFASLKMEDTLSPERLASAALTGQSISDIKRFLDLVALSKVALVQHQAAVGRDFAALVADVPFEHQAEYNQRMQSGLARASEKELRGLAATEELARTALAICNLIQERRSGLRVTDREVLFVRDADIAEYERLYRKFVSGHANLVSGGKGEA